MRHEADDPGMAAATRLLLVFRLVAEFTGKQLRMDTTLFPTSRRGQHATPWEVAAFTAPADDARIARPLAPGPVDDAEQPVIDEVAPGLEDLGLFA
jgi:hypothetical protein